MAYKERVFNAGILTDLLGTYLQQKDVEREKYYKAERKIQKEQNEPIYKIVDGNLVRINKKDNSFETIIKKQQEKKEPKFEDFPQMDKDGNPTGMTVKGMFTGTDKTFFGVPPGYEPVGKKSQFKPEDKNKRKEKKEDANIQFANREITRLRKIRDKDYTVEELTYMGMGMKPPVFTPEMKERLDFYEQVLFDKGYSVYGKNMQKKSNQEYKNKSIKEWTDKDYEDYRLEGFSENGRPTLEELKININKALGGDENFNFFLPPNLRNKKKKSSKGKTNFWMRNVSK